MSLCRHKDRLIFILFASVGDWFKKQAPAEDLKAIVAFQEIVVEKLCMVGNVGSSDKWTTNFGVILCLTRA
jgi:hypothetical protein